MSSIADNVGTVTRRIQKATLDAGRAPGSVRLLAVSKTRPAEDVRTAYAAGQTAFGENYLQEALEKIDTLGDLPGLEWHFIGPIQSNKTRQIANAFKWVHSVDRLKIARRLSEQRENTAEPLNICLQVNINEEDSKAGCLISELPGLAEDVLGLPNVCLRGLMAIPDPDQPAPELKASFERLAAALEDLRQSHPDYRGLDTLSMGMSADLEVAVAAGATWVRIGTAIFGMRH
ncbi:YggS family pyridoxal phosphate-dependent enzyme [Marinobacter sp. CHS3-4]|uniref:YggS family pyridoxal phosphate-dependent enzyme n=1 Tax=Marinobacter sp. CHS3-4 TaxID=3045174 RepID=UPI0024B4D26F|nr:YggS family pyridoxal phosphate-dependent enzyme [Marinobacter sp. CHS3-4]MDI9246538.1 YggS family pyridoxal phosphate-dependent enzyme [Marinobacter sp. CHS3-4]